MEELEITRGDDVSISFTYKDAAGVAIDITNYTIFLTAKSTVDTDSTDTNAAIWKDVITHSDPTAGESIITLTDAQTNVTPALYLADIQVKDTSGNIVSSSLFNLKVNPDITRRITT